MAEVICAETRFAINPNSLLNLVIHSVLARKERI
jgi:hypothetical protein